MQNAPKRKFKHDQYYLVDWSGSVTVSRKSFPSLALAEIAKARRERDTGQTWFVNSGKDLEEMGVH